MNEEQYKMLIETESRSKSNSKRIDELEADGKEIHRLAISVERLAASVERFAEEQGKLKKDIEEIKKEPADNWKSAKRTAIAAVISAIFGAAATGIIVLIAQQIGG